jgi:hypothetical protein
VDDDAAWKTPFAHAEAPKFFDAVPKLTGLAIADRSPWSLSVISMHICSPLMGLLGGLLGGFLLSDKLGAQHI